MGSNRQYSMRCFSWTFITWIVVFGSSIVMLLWIVVYSFFPGSDLTQEVVILFSEVVFWVTVLISVTVALGSPTILLEVFAVLN